MKILCYLLGHRWELIKNTNSLFPYIDKHTGLEFYLCERCRTRTVYKKRKCVECNSHINLKYQNGFTVNNIKCMSCIDEDERLRSMLQSKTSKKIIEYERRNYHPYYYSWAVSGTAIDSRINDFDEDRDISYIG